MSVRQTPMMSTVVMMFNHFCNLLNFQDYSKFLDDDFDVKDWVNGAFNAQKEGNKDVSNE